MIPIINVHANIAIFPQMLSKFWWFFAEILDAHATEETDSTSTITTQAQVHPIPADVDLDIDLEVKLEIDEDAYQEEEGEIEEIETENAASALMLLSQQKTPFNIERFPSLWEGKFHMHYP